jgi:hypothetical protein
MNNKNKALEKKIGEKYKEFMAGAGDLGEIHKETKDLINFCKAEDIIDVDA